MMPAYATGLRDKSAEVYQNACEVIPGGVNSPVRAFTGLEISPLIPDSGSGEKLVDIDGRTYLDFCMSWGALIHGHTHPRIVEAVQTQVAKGSSFGLTTASEVKLAKKIVELIPAIEAVRFVSSGTEATMSAVRLARAFTGRDLVIKFSGHYHGHSDSFLVQGGSGLLNLSASSAGVCQDFVKNTLSLPFNDFETCYQVFKEHGEKVAAVILEPVAANMGVVHPKNGFLQMLRQETEKAGALLIFDEVITGFRVALGGAQALYDVTADLVCLGKIVGGGFPAAAFGGRREIMECLAPSGPVYQAGTLSGNPVAMEAGYQTLLLCGRPSFYQSLERKTTQFLAPLRKWIEEEQPNLCLHQAGSLFTLFFGKRQVDCLEDVKACDINQFNHFYQTLFERGIYLSPSQFEANFVSSAHTERSLNHAMEVIVDSLESIIV
ncbi:MAG: glutamate-1-semialdehyde 2,1-aminomutase [Chlamydiales bacterium]